MTVKEEATMQDTYLILSAYALGLAGAGLAVDSHHLSAAAVMALSLTVLACVGRAHPHRWSCFLRPGIAAAAVLASAWILLGARMRTVGGLLAAMVPLQAALAVSVAGRPVRQRRWLTRVMGASTAALWLIVLTAEALLQLLTAGQSGILPPFWAVLAMVSVAPIQPIVPPLPRRHPAVLRPLGENHLSQHGPLRL